MTAPAYSVLPPAAADVAPREQRRAAALLLALLVCGALLRFYRLGSNSLWVDEFATVRISLLSLPEIFAENIRNKSFEPPLYFWLVHGVVGVLGSSETALRLASAVAGTLSIPVVWLLTREVTSNVNTALLSAALLTFNPLHLWYSQEARPYALFLLFVCLAGFSLSRAFRAGGRTAWAGFAGFTLLAVFTHLVGLALLLVAWGWGIALANGRKLIRPLLIQSAVVLACVGPLLVAIAAATAGAPDTGSPPRAPTGLEIPYTLLTYVAGYSFGPSLRELQNLGTRAALAANLFQSGLAVVILAGLALLIARRLQRDMTGFAILFAIYVGVIFLASVVTGKAYSIRYTLPGLIGFLGMVALAISNSDPALRRAWLALVLALFAWADAQWFFSPAYWKDDSRAAVHWLSQHLPPGATVAVAPAYATRVLTHYARLEGTDLHLVSAVPAGGWEAQRPAALVLTRLHHVPDQVGLVTAFRRLAGPHLLKQRVVGYDMWLDDQLAQNSAGQPR